MYIKYIRTITPIIVAAICFSSACAITLFKVGDLSQVRTNSSYYLNDTNNLDTELPQLRAQVTTQQPQPEQSASDLIVLFLVSFPIVLLLFNQKKEKPPSVEEKLGKAISEYLTSFKKD